jgi:uncharacterized membrane protein
MSLFHAVKEVHIMSTRLAGTSHVVSPSFEQDIARVDAAAPLQWIRQGAADFRRAPGLSLLYGVLFAGVCAGAFLMTLNVPWYTLGYLTGLVVIGPFLASGLYVASRDIERGIAPSISGSLRLLSQRRTHLALFSLMLALVMAAWVRASALLFALKFNTLTPSVETYTSLLSSSDGWIAIAFYAGIGLLLVTTVFVISAVAIPLILDKDADFVRAMRASYLAVTRNPRAMLVWAAAIVALTAVGIATAFVGLAVIFPILGYATWHSYRSLVR